MLDYVGKPQTKDTVAKFVHHDGRNIWVQSPTGGVTDSLLFVHEAGHSCEAINRMFKGRMVRIHSELQGNGSYFNTLYYA